MKKGGGGRKWRQKSQRRPLGICMYNEVRREREREVRQSGREERGKKDERKEVSEKAGWREKKEGMKGQEK